MSETSSDWQRTTIDSAQAAAHPETAQAVARIKALRQTIDNIDSAVIALLAERFKATSQVGVLKANAGRTRRIRLIRPQRMGTFRIFVYRASCLQRLH